MYMYIYLLALLDINDKYLFKDLRVCKLETQLGKNSEMFWRRKKSSEFLIVKKYILIRIRTEFFALRKLSVGHQTVWMMGGRLWMSGSPGTWPFRAEAQGYLRSDVNPGIDPGVESLKV